MQSAEISSRALRFFEQRGHTVVLSASLIADDPTLLLINAGMAPFKSYFLGKAPAPFPRATSVQKCVRTVDIEEVGKTTRHASFFQMIGNFSFGDYFKDKAILYAWELLTRSTAEGGLGLPESKLWVTVYTDDDEAERIWRTVVGVPAERIQRLGIRGYQASWVILVNHAEPHCWQPEQGLQSFFGVLTLMDQPAYFGTLGLPRCGAPAELRRLQLHFQAVRGLVNEHVAVGGRVFRRCGVPQLSRDTVQPELQPPVLSALGTTATMRRPVITRPVD